MKRFRIVFATVMSACGDYSVTFSRKPKITGLASPIAGVRAAYSPSQNYPNPFNPSTVISYQLPVVSDVRLVVYDLFGRGAAVLVNERKTAGPYEVKFDAAGLSSGVNGYRIQAGDFEQANKLAILK